MYCTYLIFTFNTQHEYFHNCVWFVKFLIVYEINLLLILLNTWLMEWCIHSYDIEIDEAVALINLSMLMV